MYRISIFNLWIVFGLLISPRTIQSDLIHDNNSNVDLNNKPTVLLEIKQNPNYENIEKNKLNDVHEYATVQQKIRNQRSTVPNLNLNEIFPKSNQIFDGYKNDVYDSSGRYYNYIKPTSTHNEIIENVDVTKNQKTLKDTETTKNVVKSAKSLSPSTTSLDNVTLSWEIEPRSHFLDSSLINSTSVIQTSEIVIPTVKLNNPRQNHNPDIQDIITGIVKLLNGNVNVHANTQAHRRPVSSRINNRGPPRISEAQPLPIDFDIQKPGSSIRPPPYHFERPDSAIRPFITGVPIPEQIVPAIQQQNYRPGFISQNHPPWHRQRPRPPFGTNKRPIPPYKPLPPSMENYNPDDELQITTIESSDENNETFGSMIPPTGSSFDKDISSIIDKEESKTSSLISKTFTKHTSSLMSTSIPNKKEEHIKKKDTLKNKSTEKKPIIPITGISSNNDDMTTIIQSTSVVHTAQIIGSTTTVSSPHQTEALETSIFPSNIESSIEEISSSSPSSTTSSSSINSSSISLNLEEIELTTSTKPLAVLNSNSSLITTSSAIPKLTESLATISKTQTTSEASLNPPMTSYHPHPGIVLDDPEFKPGGAGKTGQRPIHRPPSVQPTQHHHHPPGYGEIFDVTLSAIQGPGSLSGSQHVINIKPYAAFGGGVNNEDIIILPSGNEDFVSINGKRTYINLFGETTNVSESLPTVFSQQHPHTNQLTSTSHHSGIINGFNTITRSESSVISIQPTKLQKTNIVTTQSTQITSQRPHYKPRTTQPPVRIDTCIVGDDSTCDQAQNERCKTENGVSSCHCRPGYSRRKYREPCRRVVSFIISLRIDRIYERKIVWDKLFTDKNSEPYSQLAFECVRAIDSAMSMTPFSDEFIEAKVNNIYQGDASKGIPGVFVNLTLRLEENTEILRPNLRNDIQKHLLGVLHRRNNNIGNSVLYVDSPVGSVSALHDLDECQSKDLNDCHINAICTNIWGSFRCECEKGYRDPWSDQSQRAGKECLSCPQSHCNNRGTCSYDNDGSQICTCDGSYYGSQCEIDGEVLGVAIGASVAAVIIIVLTLICLIMWSRRWHREQKNALGSPVFGYMTTSGPVKSSMAAAAAAAAQSPYQVTLEDRMRWAQIADVMAQANHYAAEPVAPTRPSSAMFGYPNLQTLNMGTMGGISYPVHSAQSMPPVPLPRRLGLNTRSNGMRTLENSSLSEEEDRTDLLGRNFQVPRPKSRSNGSITNQSGIYYDVEYEPAGGGDLYGTTMSVSNPVPGPQGIPMSTYTSGRIESTYYMKSNK